MSHGEQMTSAERVAAAIARRQPDRVPVLVLTRDFGIRYSGLKFSDCLKDPSAYVHSQVKCLRDFGYDGVWGISVDGISEALGATLEEHDDDAPAIKTHPVKTIDDVQRLGEIDVLRNRRIQYQLKLVRDLKTAVGKDVPVITWAPAPLRTACMLRGMENAYMDMIRDPSLIEALADVCVQPSVSYATACAEAGADLIYVSNPVGDASAISRKHYEQYSVPYSTRMFTGLHQNGVKVIYHFYGSCSDRLDLVMAQAPDVLLGVDVDLAELKKISGNRFTLMGNVRNIATMFEGTPADVEKESIRCMAQAGQEGAYILSSGGGLGPATPPENVAAMVAAAKRYGVYPLSL